jgi:hypothetical protein
MNVTLSITSDTSHLCAVYILSMFKRASSDSTQDVVLRRIPERGYSPGWTKKA